MICFWQIPDGSFPSPRDIICTYKLKALYFVLSSFWYQSQAKPVVPFTLLLLCPCSPISVLPCLPRGVLEDTARLRDGGSWCKLHQVLPPSIHPDSLVLGTKVSLTSLQFPGSPLSSLQKLPVAEGFLQFLGTCSDLFHPLKKVESSLTLPAAGFLSTLDTSCLVLRLSWVEISQDS